MTQQKEFIMAVKIKKRYSGASLDNFRLLSEEHRKVVDFLRNGIKNGFDRNVLITGPCGVGKTYLAYCLLEELSKKTKFCDNNYYYSGGKVDYINTKEFLDNLKPNSDIKVSWSDKKDIPLLIMDEFGVPDYTDFERAEIFKISDYRYEQCLPTILISNADIDYISKNIGRRSADRFFGDCVKFNLLATSGRKKC